MPLIKNSSYQSPFFLFNGHLQTIIPFLFRRVNGVSLQRETIYTEDGDFLDLDWIYRKRSKLVILTHGFEGDSRRTYMLGMAKLLDQSGFDVICWNFRGCSGKLNHTPGFYHSGKTDDLHRVITHALETFHYEAIGLIGFSLGGNLTLKYLGEQVYPLPDVLKGAVTISVPLNLHSSAIKMKRWQNWLYSKRFLITLKRKIRAKAKFFPDACSTENLKKVNSIFAFDDYFTGPMFGFRDAADYYRQCSAINFLQKIEVPSLIINARNDPFLSEDCFPEKLAQDHPMVNLETPSEGGHCGFMEMENIKGGPYWSDKRALKFLETIFKPYKTPQ